MTRRTIVLLLALGLLGRLLGIGDEDEPGWLSEALASQDPDVEAAIDAYEGEDYEGATEHLDAAVARRGERAELYYDRGLVLLAQGDADAARAAFEHGTESSELSVQASSHYELGNLAFAAEDWEGAIAQYIECLTAQPDHQHAKWNLELALLRKAEQEKQEQEQQEQDQQNQDQDQNQGGDQGEQDQQENQDQQEQQDQQEGQDQQQQDQQQDQQDQGEQDQQQQQQQQQQDQPQPQQEPQEREVQAQPIDSGALDAALDELDREDAFMFGRPRGANRKVEKDW